MRIRLLLILMIFAGALGWFIFQALPDEAEQPPAPQASEILGAEETCVNCHQDMTGFEPVHSPQVIGCSPCHLGDPRSADKDLSHQGMILTPGNLSDVHQTCGTANCHADLAGRVDRSLMTTMAGIIAVDKFAFGESPTLSGDYHIQQLGSSSAADLHLRHLCASCHLGNTKEQFGPVTELSRGGGCNACHLNYSADAQKGLETYVQTRSLPPIHPALNLKVNNDHCFGCHSRSGRISTNYEGWHETQFTPEEVKGKSGFRLLQDGRVFQYISPDVHHSAGMECIDCHHPTEIMGDGKIHLHEEDAVRVRCEDCHFEGPAKTTPYARLDAESKKLLGLRGWDGIDRHFLSGAQSGLHYYHIEVVAGQPRFKTKNTGITLPLRPPAAACTREGAHRDLSCSACHTAWAPQCAGCHNAYEQQKKGYDLLAKKPTKGKWVEYLGEFFAEPPTLGVVELEPGKVRDIQAFIPGMIMTIDPSGFPGHPVQKAGEIFHRLFAPVSPHTTGAAGRSCQSCHNDPLALGYGRGKLEYVITGKQGRWHFTPAYANSPQDQLPQDAWIGFLQAPTRPYATRDKARPFTIAEQQRILTVGACLTCHADGSRVMQNSLKDFIAVKRRMTDRCMAPGWGVGNRE